MKRVILFLAIATLHAEDSKPSFKIVATATHGEVMVEWHRAAEGTEQIWLVSSTDPAKRHLLYTHHRRADVIFSDDDEWLVINDHAGSGYSAVLLYRRKNGLEYERVADLTAPAWKYFNQRNGFKETPFDHAYASAACWVSTDPPILLIRLSGHLSGPAGILKQSLGWHFLYNIQTQSFSTNLGALNDLRLVTPNAADAMLPEGFTIPPSTLSPDGRLGVLVPDVDHYRENNGNRLVDATTGRELALIRAATGMKKMNHGGINPQWTVDGQGLLWVVGGKWFPRAMVYLRIADGKVQWQRDLLTMSQQEILKRVRKADPVAYANVVKENKGHAEAFPEGFTIDVNIVGNEVALPLHFIVALTSDPKHLNCPPGGETNSGRLYDPPPSARKPFDVMPQGEVVEARMRGMLAADGAITWSGFRVATGAKAVKRHQYLTADEWQGDLPDDLTAKLRTAVPEALAAAQSYANEHPKERCWSIRLTCEPRAPDSLAVDFLMLIDSNNRELPDFPQAGEIMASLGGSLEEDGTLRWGRRVVSTGPEAVHRRVAMKQDDFFQTEARAEIRRRVEAAAPETMAALRAFAATQPQRDDICTEDFDTPSLLERHPGIRPAGFALTLEPAYVDSREVKLPLEAEFQARLDGALQADGTIAWGSFTLIDGEDARKARRARDSALNHAGWPSF